MSKQANTRLIGGFVVGAVVLIVAGLLLFGSGNWFRKHNQFVLFFSDSVSGLNVGATVDFRGVKVGTVTDIKVVLDKKDLSLKIPVFIEIDPRKVSFAQSGEELDNAAKHYAGAPTLLEVLIKRGLKAQLSMQSLITGQLGIHLDFFPDQPAKFVEAEPDFEQIPTVESPFSAIAKTVQNIPLTQIANKLLETLNQTEKLIGSSHLTSAIVSLDKTVKAAHLLLVNLNRQIKPLAEGAKGNLVQSKKMFTSAAKLAEKLNSDVPRVVLQLNETLKSAGVTLRGANDAIGGFTADSSPVRVQLLATLNELASAARSFRVLADYLDSHPEALVRGKRK
ncbi:MAG: MlaD family protein [Syntrophobacteraceae bacterium]|nr:MlaD family protein [Syntrophobacteraceae bacterium]